ncbi:MAG TPA: cell envelope biogenesis protein TolA, partial [Sphingomicrobium sp.]|nr:cell envelope biogenesis protein TolA [Sphingomicrobium sp.]
PRPAPPAPARPAPRVSRIGDDFLKGIADDKLAPRPGPAPRPAAAKFDASALASIQQAIRRQIQPCADRQVDPGPGANQIRVTLNLRLSKSGRLIGPPRVVRTSGVDSDNERYEERVKDLAVAAYTGCAPLTGLPPELYQTPEGGWSNINMTYRLP